MEISVKKWGNSLAIRIPSEYAKDINIKDGTAVDLIKSEDKLVIKPKRQRIKLNDLLSKISSENIHEEINSGDKVGNEIW